MRRFVFLALATALVVFTALAGPAGRTRAAALNESDTPAEADFCLLEFIDTEVIGPGEVFGVYGQIFEASLTEVVGDTGAIIAEAGIGPLGTDPRFDAGWTFTSASYNQDLSNNDQYFAVVTAPLPPTTTDYSVTFRFSFDGVDHTYCDFDGAGSDPGADYDAALNGTITVNGTGATGSSEGSVNTSVDVIADPGACIILNTDTVNYGQLPFSTPGQAQSGGSFVTISSCSLTTSLDLLGKGTDASGPSANWQLTTPPGSDNMCDSGGGGIDRFGQRLVHGQTLASLDLTLTNQTYATGLGIGQSLDTGVDILMPCVGSSGVGETVSSTVMFTAVTSGPQVDDDGDGYSPPADCDDADPMVNPAAPEVVGDGIDNNCDGQIDESGVDADADGYSPPADCDDSNASINPGAPEVAGDGIDNDCDGLVDESENVCANFVDFLPEGTTGFDSSECTTAPGEPVASCQTGGSGHADYLAFELQPGQTGQVSVFSAWDAVIAVYDESLGEWDCADLAFGGASETVVVTNNTGTSQFYFVQVDGFEPADFGPYDATLSITP